MLSGLTDRRADRQNTIVVKPLARCPRHLALRFE